MQTYCKHTNNIYPNKLIMMTSKKIKGTSGCAIYMTNKSFYDKIKYKSELDIIVSYKTKHANLLCKVEKKKLEI